MMTSVYLAVDVPLINLNTLALVFLSENVLAMTEKLMQCSTILNLTGHPHVKNVFAKMVISSVLLLPLTVVNTLNGQAGATAAILVELVHKLVIESYFPTVLTVALHSKQ